MAAEDLAVVYRRPGQRTVTAVDGVSLAINRGQTLGLVGESGSGKTTIGSVMLGLIQPDQGRVLLDGEPAAWRSRAQRAVMARRIQAVFQDPFGSMNPVRKIGQTMSEVPRYNLHLKPSAIAERIERALADVGMASDVLDRYPAQFSGGQLQRLAIARALVVEPEFMVCDEAVSSLDLSVQAQVINLLASLAVSRGLAYLFISHDLTVVRHLSHEIAVLYAGQIVEQGPASAVATNPRHPYTKALVLAAPVPQPAEQRARREARLRLAAPSARGQTGLADQMGQVSLADSRPLASRTPSSGCRWAPRCRLVRPVCRSERPVLSSRRPGWKVACHFDTEAGLAPDLGEST
jgi:ABC-type oligopeptide transport system ATPase subunit